ncbi:MAG: MFS transporter [Acidobacteriaceae bacterium]|nr:MFS transporter [Acidobacteriaceae bacterium]
MFQEVYSRAHSRLFVAVITFSLFIDYFLYGVLLPLAAHSPTGLNSEEQLAWLYGVYAISALVVTPMFGYWGDRFGSRSILLCGIVLVGCATALFALAPSLPILLFAKFCQGAASAALWTAGLSSIAAYYVEKRVEMIGYAFTGSTAGSVLGPIAGGFLAQVGGYKLPFFLTGVLLAINASLIILVFPRGRRTAKEKLSLRPLLLNRSLGVPALAVALAAFAVGVIEPLLPVRLARYGVTPKTIGLIFTISTLAYGLSAPLVGRVSERWSASKTIILGAIAMAGTLPLLAAFKQAGLVCLAVALVYISFAFLLNPASAELGNVVDRAGMSCYSAVYAVYNIVYSVGMLATAALAPTAARLLGFLGTLLCVSAILLLCIPLLISTKPPIVVPEASEGQAY